MPGQLAKYTDLSNLSLINATAATVNVEVDRANYEGVLFLGVAGSTSGTATLTISTAASTTDTFTNLSGATDTATASQHCGVDVYQPRERWLKGTLTTTANQRLTVLAIKYGPKKAPTTWSSTSGGAPTALQSPNT